MKIFDSNGTLIVLTDDQSKLLLKMMKTLSDPRVSSCVECNSCVVASEPLGRLVDEMLALYPNNSDFLSTLNDFIENSESVHLYLWEENECVHRLWMDPISNEWSAVTGEKKLHK